VTRHEAVASADDLGHTIDVVSLPVGRIRLLHGFHPGSTALMCWRSAIARSPHQGGDRRRAAATFATRSRRGSRIDREADRPGQTHREKYVGQHVDVASVA
jgi:hypothetical protein